jgi:SAM-dependent methyltransferase
VLKSSLTVMNARPFEALTVRDASILRDRRRVLNAGAGPRSQNSLHAVFKSERWREVRLDVNPATAPDVVASIANMRSFFSSASFDAVWSSHSLEHLHTHEVPSALAEVRHVLKPDGFALISCPDLEAVAAALIDNGPDHVAYVSAMGPITPLDMLFGHSASLAAGNRHMAHKTAFTAARLGRLLLDAGFVTVLTRTLRFDLWALALMEQADEAAIADQFRAARFDVFDARRRGSNA